LGRKAGGLAYAGGSIFGGAMALRSPGLSGQSHWLNGQSRSGKSTWLIEQVAAQAQVWAADLSQGRSLLVFAANGDNRIRLADRLGQHQPALGATVTTTPNGFMQDEVRLFWPLLVESLPLVPQFSLRLRPETEQYLALQQWQTKIEDGTLTIEGWPLGQTVRRFLDLLQLAAAAGIPAEAIAERLESGIPAGFAPAETWHRVGTALVAWRDWCLSQGFLTYGIITELYWRHLLPHPAYRQALRSRFCAVFADDLDEYPAVVGHWFGQWLDWGVPCHFTWNPMGQVRLGVGADPAALVALQACCDQHHQPHPGSGTLAYTWGDAVMDWVGDPLAMPDLAAPIHTLHAVSRGELLRRTAETLAEAIDRGDIEPSQAAIIGPGLDSLARYSLGEILTERGIPVVSLNDQRPLVQSPLVRALLTLLTLVFPGLGRLAGRDAVAEMLVVLSQVPPTEGNQAWFDTVHIDPVRAELLADHCFQPDIAQPRLLPVERFPRWDRLGYQATRTYTHLREWIDDQVQQRQQRRLLGPVALLDRAIQTWLRGGSHLPFDQLTAVRELMETAQHFWEVSDRLGRGTGTEAGAEALAVGQFVQLLRQGTVSANPFPVESRDPAQGGVMIATVFQYRLQRLGHRWQFWLDAGSPRWLTGTDTLFGFPLFLADWDGTPWSVATVEALHSARLERILRDLLGRTTERVVLCHSDLSVSGQDQLGPLLGLVEAYLGRPEMRLER